MKSRKFLTSILAGSIIITSISPFISENMLITSNTVSAHDITEDNLSLSNEDLAYFNLLDKMPLEIAQRNIDDGVRWLNENKPNDLLFGNFIATTDGYIKFNSYQRSWGCALGVANALATLMPWTKVLKMKQSAQALGGIYKVATIIYNKYKYLVNTSRYYKYNKWQAMKTAVSQTTSAMPSEVRSAFLEFLGVGGLTACFD